VASSSGTGGDDPCVLVPAEESLRSPPDNVYAIRSIVGQWLRLRAKHAHESPTGLLPGTLGIYLQRQVFTQLAADADHSDLLVRLLLGEEPQEFAEWKEKYLAPR
jgi:hypothetical protein